MIRDQMISFLQAVVVFLLLTNALSVVATAWAIRIANGSANKKSELMTAVERRLGAMLGRAA